MKSSKTRITSLVRSTRILWVSLLLISTADQIYACSCIGESSVKEAIKNADAIIFGTILSKQIITLNDTTGMKISPDSSGKQISSIHRLTIARYQLLVEDIYKGTITTDTITIQTGIGGGDCGIRFETGEKYVIYGTNRTYFGRNSNDFKQSKNVFWTNSCLRTTAYINEEIAEIRKFAKKRKIK